MTPKLTARQQAHFDKLPERNKETLRAFWASEAGIALGSSGAHSKATRSKTPSASPKVTKPLHPKTEERRTYIGRYGNDAWKKAVTVAGRHRARASKDFGLTEHFTAPQWLDLCARFGGRCPWCASSDTVQAHHRLALHKQGVNTIDNIWPLCLGCHQWFHSIDCTVSPCPVKVDAAWYQAQVSLSSALKAGDTVFHWARVPATVVEVLGLIPLGLPPSRVQEDGCQTWGPIIMTSQSVLVEEGDRVAWYGKAEAVIRNGDKKQGLVQRAYVEHLQKVDADAWMAGQEALFAKFRIGDIVEYNEPDYRHAHRCGTIHTLIPPRSGRVDIPGSEDEGSVHRAWWEEAKARVSVLGIRGKPRLHSVGLSALERVERQADAVGLEDAPS